LTGEISVSQPGTLSIPVGDKEAVLWCQEATVVVKDKDGIVIRKASSKKTVKRVLQFGNYPPFPDVDGLAKAETGAIARALGVLGILAFPGSGIATAEDMNEHLRDMDHAQSGSGNVGDKPVRRAPNPKNQASQGGSQKDD
jgi:hypothetical protein